jgi:hypothetical protein
MVLSVWLKAYGYTSIYTCVTWKLFPCWLTRDHSFAIGYVIQSVDPCPLVEISISSSSELFHDTYCRNTISAVFLLSFCLFVVVVIHQRCPSFKRSFSPLEARWES